VRARSPATPRRPRGRAIGLDYHTTSRARGANAACSRRRSASTRELRLPVIVHTREADDDTVGILREEGGGEVGGVFHWLLRQRKLGPPGARPRLLLSFSGIITFPKAGPLRETVAQEVPGRPGCWWKPTYEIVPLYRVTLSSERDSVCLLSRVLWETTEHCGCYSVFCVRRRHVARAHGIARALALYWYVILALVSTRHAANAGYDECTRYICDASSRSRPIARAT